MEPARSWAILGQNYLGIETHSTQPQAPPAQEHPSATGPRQLMILSRFSLYLRRKGLVESQHLDPLIFIIMLFHELVYK